MGRNSAVELNLPEGDSFKEGEAVKIVEKYVTYSHDVTDVHL